MTIIKEQEENGCIVVIATGHAGYSANNDPVCAAVSILIHSLAENFKGIAKIELKEEVPMAVFVFERNLKNIMTYRIIRKGLELLQEAYPDNVKIASSVF